MPIKVLVVDDSPAAHRMLSSIIDSAPDMAIVGAAVDGMQAIQMAMDLHPDVILMDWTMGDMDGLEITREIMNVNPKPIVIISANPEDAEATISHPARNAGALCVLQKPAGPKSPNYAAFGRELLGTLRAMAGVEVIRHWKSDHVWAAQQPAPPMPAENSQADIVAIVASTGGPHTLGDIIKELPPTFNLPVVIIQHLLPDFIPILAQWLGIVSRLPVCIAQPDEHPQSGTIYIAPGKKHLRMGSSGCFELSDTPTDVAHTPSGDIFLESVARYYGARAVGIVLTGMGRDGARGLRAMYDAGAMTIAQDEATSVIFGMPHEAVELGAARQILPPHGIVNVLLQCGVWNA